MTLDRINMIYLFIYLFIKIWKALCWYFMRLYVLTCQVSQLYDVVQKWDAMSTSIPQVVQRLVAVKELHEQGKTQEWKLFYSAAA